MPKRCIGIDIGRTHVCAAQVLRTADGFRLEKAFAMQTRRSTDSLSAILHALTSRHGFDRRAAVAVSLPQHAFFFADLETDAKGLERIRAGDLTALHDRFPIPADDLVAQICAVLPMEKGSHSMLIAATSRQSLSESVQSLSQGRIKPVCLDTPIAALQATLTVNHPEAGKGLAVVVYVDEATLSLAVLHEGTLLQVRNIPIFSADRQDVHTFARQTADIVAQEIEITWKRLFGNDPDAGLRLFLFAGPPAKAALASALEDKTAGQVIPVDPWARVARSETNPDLPLSVAAGLALRVLQPRAAEHTDFLSAYQARTKPGRRLTRELGICGGLAAAAALIWGVGLFVQLSALEADYARLKKQTEEVFRQAVPEETVIVDPAAQLRQRLAACRQECELLTGLHSRRSAPLEILYALGARIPATGDLQLQDVLIAANSVRIMGTCDSFTTLTEWQRLLGTIPGLRVVDAPSTKNDAQSGRVQFTISLSADKDKA
ncbi:MAG: hypothetical protein MUC88_02375 [Planctomycetes bacterium]|jgi:Tfp pilus assembly PilM family ATPase|nr:hypothetical protein [Planctomycetota bacterium]